MSKINSTMTTGKRSLMNAQTGLQTVSHNISNKTTEGFTRQRVDFKATPPVNGTGRYQIGTGADVGAVIRVNNPHLEKQIEQEQQKMGFNEGQLFHLSRVEDIFNDQVSKGVGHFLGEFFNSFRDLANNPESLPLRTQVKENALNVTKDFKRINSSLKEIQKNVDRELELEVEEINRMTSEIASLNQKIANVEIQRMGAQANDFRDRRDLLVKKLSEKLNIKVAEGKSGAINVMAGDTGLLVADFTSYDLKAHTSPERGKKREGAVDIMFRSSEQGSYFTMTDQIRGGKLGALIEVRDKTVNGFLERLDTMAQVFTDRINEVHVTGYDQYGNPSGNFFDRGPDGRDVSQTIELNKAILNDVTRIGTAGAPNSPGDNRVAQVIAALQYQPVMPNGLNSIEEYYKDIVGDVGVITKKSKELNDHQVTVMEQLKNLRESISGVNLDEETIKMIEFQKNFDASAKLIRTVDEMLDTVINLKR